MLSLREYLLQVVQSGSQLEVSLLKRRSTTIGADSPRELSRRYLLDVSSFPGVSLVRSLEVFGGSRYILISLACSIMMPTMAAAVRGSCQTSTPAILEAISNFCTVEMGRFLKRRGSLHPPLRLHGR